jgi:O-antigen ligase
MTERLAFNSGRELVQGYDRTSAARVRVSAPSTGTPPPVRTDPSPIRKRGSSTDWAWRGLVLFTFVLFFRPQDQIRALAVLHLAEVFALLGIGALVFGRMSRGLPITRDTRELRGILAFGLAMLASIPTSAWPGGSVQVFTEMVIKLFLIFALLVNTLDRPARLDQLTLLMVSLSGYIGLRAVFDAARGIHLVEGDRLRGSIGGIFGNPNDLAMNMVVFLPFATLWTFRDDVAMWKRAIAAASALLMLATIVLTRSRAGTLGLIATILVLVIRSIRVKPAIAAATLAAVIVAVPFAPKSYWVRMSSILEKDKDATGSRQARIELMKEGLSVYLSYPVLGVGLGQFVNFDPGDRKNAWRVTHNALLQVATELGTVGLIPFVYLLWCAAKAPGAARAAILPERSPPGRGRSAGRHQRMRTEGPGGEAVLAAATAVGPSLVGWFVCAFFASVALNWTFYYLLALAACTRDIARVRLDVTQGPALRRAS